MKGEIGGEKVRQKHEKRQNDKRQNDIKAKKEER